MYHLEECTANKKNDKQLLRCYRFGWNIYGLGMARYEMEKEFNGEVWWYAQ